MKIGGEFEFDLEKLYRYSPSKVNASECENYFASGRIALLSILISQQRERKHIYVPYYICKSVIQVILLADYTISYYELDNDLHFPVSLIGEIETEASVLVVDYFGLCDNNSRINQIKQSRPDIVIIHDLVQAFWNFEQSNSDFSFTSFRKYFPVPDGAMVGGTESHKLVTKTQNPHPFYLKKLLGSVLKASGADDEAYLTFFTEGEEMLDSIYEIATGSKESLFLFQQIDHDHVKKVRKENYSFVYEYGKEKGFKFMLPYNDSHVPLNIPVLLKNRNEVRSQLMQHNIFLPVHWQLEDYNMNSAQCQFFAKHELSLVIDQRYSIDHMKYQLDSIIKYI